MTNATHLHFFQCSFCKVVATAPVRPLAVFQCCSCARLLRYLWSERITTEKMRELAGRGLVYAPFQEPREPQPDRPKKCHRDRCRVFVAPSEMVDRLFCSQRCAEMDAEEMKALTARLEKLYQERPHLRPSDKEVTR